MSRIITTILIASLASSAAAADPKRPNIVVILSDDMGFSDLGCTGGEIATPNLDALAAGGVRFTQFYNTARCCPTRASLLTSLHPHQAGFGHMTPPEGTSLRPAFDNKPLTRVGLFWEHEGNRAIRVGDWKLVSKYGEPWELFDLTTDRVESHDVGSAFPETVKDLSAKWDAWAKRINVVDWSEILKRTKK